MKSEVDVLSELVCMFPTIGDLLAFECQVLSCGDQFLPPEALQVRHGGVETKEYWEFLINQKKQMEIDNELYKEIRE